MAIMWNNHMGISQEHCTNQVTITLMLTLLADWVTFIFLLREIVTASKPNLFIFISAREFSFPYFAFNLLKIFMKFEMFLHGEFIFFNPRFGHLSLVFRD